MASLPARGNPSASRSASGSKVSGSSGGESAQPAPAPAPRRTAARSSAAADASAATATAAAAASQAAAPSIAKPAQQQQQQQPSAQIQHITLSTPTQSGGARTIAQVATGGAGAQQPPSPSPSPPLPLPASAAPVQFHLPSDTPEHEEIRGSASPVFSSQPPVAAPVPRLSPALRGMNAAQQRAGRGPNGSPGSSPNPSPRPSRSPSLIATPAPPAGGGGGGSRRPSFSLHDPRPVLDWKPYDPSGRSNVETILSPELREAQAKVAAKRAEHDKQERARYAHAGASADDAAAATPAAAAASSASPARHKRATHPSNGSGASLGVPHPRKALPNAHSEKTYDAAADIFGGADRDVATGGPADKQHARHAKQYGVAHGSAAAGDAHAAAPVAAASCCTRFRTFLSSSFAGEIVMRTNPLPCFPAATARSHPVARRDAAGMRSAPVRPRALGPPPGARWLYRLLEHSTPYTVFSICLTVFSLFAFDFSVAFLPKSLDASVAGLLLACLVIFAAEIAAHCYAKANYCLVSFLFWLDVVGTFSLCFDIYWIAAAMFGDGGGDSDGDGDTQRVGESGGQVGRSASILRLTKFARVLRVLKLVRIVRVFKFNAALQKTSLGSRGHSATPSKVGLTLSERQDKIVIGLVMLLLILAPFFQVTPVEDMSGGLGLQMLGDTGARLGVDRAGTLAAESLRALFDDQLRSYVATQINSNHLCYLSLLVAQNSTTSTDPLVVVYHADTTCDLDALRGNEYAVMVYSSALSAGSSGSGSSSPGNVAIFSRRHDLFLESVFSLSYTALVVVVFVAGSFLLNRDVQILVVQPLDRMTLMVKKLAGTILFLNQGSAGGAGGPGAGGGTDGALSGLTSLNNSPRGGGGGSTPGADGTHVHSAGEINGFETEAIEGMMSQIASIFNLVPDAHDPSSGLPKSFAMLSGSKHTQIKTLNSVVQIDVSERPREPGEDGDFDPSLDPTTPAGSRRDLGPGGRSAHNLHLASAAGGVGVGAQTPVPLGSAALSSGAPSLSDFPELLSIDGILHNQLLLPYFKLFMTSSLTLENLLFVQEVDRFRTIVKLHVLNLYNSFISPRAHNQVNLPSLQRESILSALENPSACIFDEAQHECIGLMSSFLGNFHASKYCTGYMQRHRHRHHHVLLKGAVKTGTAAGITGAAVGGKSPGVGAVVERVAGPMLTASAPSRHGTAHAAQLKQISVTAAAGSAQHHLPTSSSPLNSPSNATTTSLTVQLHADSPTHAPAHAHAHVPRLYNPAHAPAHPTLELKGLGSASATPRSQEQEQLQLPGAVSSSSPVHGGGSGGAQSSLPPRSPGSKSKSKSKEDAPNRPRSTSPMAVPPRDSASPPASASASGSQVPEGRAAISRRRISGGGGGGLFVPVARSPPLGDDADDDGVPPAVRGSLERQPTFTAEGVARRSTGKRAAPVMQVPAAAAVGGAVLVGESELDAQIAALQATEGNRRSWAEREAAAQRQSMESAARRASFNRHKSMGAVQGNSIAQALDAAAAAAAAKRDGRVSPTASTAASTPPAGRTPN